MMEQSRLIAACFAVTGVFLMVCAFARGGRRGPRETTIWHALGVGCFQAIALLPGISRTGMTLGSGLLLGLEPVWATEFCLALEFPVILGALVKTAGEVYRHHQRMAWFQHNWVQVLVALAVCVVVGYAAIALLIDTVRRNRLWVFSLYLWGLALTVIFLWKRGY